MTEQFQFLLICSNFSSGDTLPFAELCATANDIFADECVNDRQCFVSFENWGEISAEEVATLTEKV